MLLIDDNNFFIDCNDATVKMLGYRNKEELLKTHPSQLSPPLQPDGRQSYEKADEMMATARKKGSHRFEWVHRRADGQDIWVEVSLNLIPSRHEKMLHTTWRDITERKQAEVMMKAKLEELEHNQQLLLQSEAKFHAVLDQSFEFIGLMKTDGTLIEANRSALAFAGISEANVLGRPFWETPWWTHSVRMQEKLKDAIKRAALGETVRFETTHPAADRSLAYVDFSLKPVVDETGKVLYLIPEGRDITERKKAEETIKESQKKLEEIVQGSPIPQFVIDKFHRVISWNRALEKYSGVKAEEIIGTTSAWKAFYKEERPVLADLLVDNALETIPEWYAGKFDQSKYVEGAYEATDFFPRMGKSGVWLYFTATLIRDSEGVVIGAVETLEDITELKVAEAAIKESEAKYRTILDNMQDVFYRSDKDGNLIMASPSVATLLGYDSLEDCLGKNIAESFYFDPVKRQEFLKEINAKGFVKNYEVTIKRQDGTPVSAATSSHYYYNSDGTLAGVEGILRDISERKQAEEALSRRLVALTRPLESMDISFSDLFNIDDIQEIQDAFCKVTGVASLITLPDGTPVTQPSNFCNLCLNIIRKTEKGRAHCQASDASIGRPNAKGPTIMHCLSGGLCNAGSSIIVGGKHIANWLIGQVKNDDIDEEKVLAYALEIGADEEEFKRGLAEVPVMSQERFDRIAHFLFLLSTELSLRAYQNVQQERFITERRQAEDALRESEHRYRDLIETTGTGYVILDMTGRVVTANNEYVRLTGHAGLEEIQDREVMEWTAPHDLERNKREVIACLERGFVRNLEIDYKHRNGTIIPVEINATVIQTKKGKLILTLCRDITDRKRAEQALKDSESRWKRMIEDSPTPMALYKLDGTVIFSNKQYVKITGWSTADIPSLDHWFTTVHPDDPQLQKEMKEAWVQRVRVAHAKGENIEPLEAPIYCRDGCTRILEFTGLVIGDMVITSFYDLTKRKEAEAALNEALEESEARYNALFFNTHSVSVLIDPDTGLIADANSAACKYYGYTREELTRMRIFDINRLPGEKVLRDLADAKTEKAKHFSTVHYLANGDRRNVEVYSGPITVEGKLLFYSITHDITDRKKAESELQNNQYLLSAAMDMANIVHWESDPSTGDFMFNDRFYSLYGTTAEREGGYQMSPEIYTREFVHPDDRALVADVIKSGSLTTDTDFRTQLEHRIIRRDGEVRHLVVRIRLIKDAKGGTIKAYGANQDITDRKRAEQALADEAKRRRILMDQSQDGIVILDDTGKVFEANHRFADMLGYPADEMKNLYVWDWDTKVSQEQIQEMIRMVDETGHHLETQHRRKDGSVLDVDISSNAAVIAGKKLIQCIVRDVTEKKRAEAALSRSEEKFREIFDKANDAIELIEIEEGIRPGRFIDVNEVACRMLQYSKEELLQHSPLEFDTMDFNPNNPQAKEILRKIESAGHAIFETGHRRKDGTIIPVEVNFHIITILDQKVGVSIIRDITDRKLAEAALKKYSEKLEEMVDDRTKELREAQDKLIKSEKLAVLGKLAGGVGHELRNPLGAIKNAAYFLDMAIENPDPDVKDTVDIINKEVKRSEDIVSSLLDFARPKVLTLRKTEINTVISDSVSRSPIPENVAVTYNLDETILEMMADPDKLLQVFTNLITNACQAMPDGGNLTLTSGLLDGGQVVVSVTDTGTGISEANMKRLFEPLFTTKMKGIGLGLVVIKAIIEAHHGSIGVRSEEGKGTTFTVKLPVGIGDGGRNGE